MEKKPPLEQKAQVVRTSTTQKKDLNYLAASDYVNGLFDRIQIVEC